MEQSGLWWMEQNGFTLHQSYNLCANHSIETLTKETKLVATEKREFDNPDLSIFKRIFAIFRLSMSLRCKDFKRCYFIQKLL